MRENIFRPGKTIFLTGLLRGTMLHFNDVYIYFKKEKGMKTNYAIVLTTFNHLGLIGPLNPRSGVTSRCSAQPRGLTPPYPQTLPAHLSHLGMGDSFDDSALGTH